MPKLYNSVGYHNNTIASYGDFWYSVPQPELARDCGGMQLSFQGNHKITDLPPSSFLSKTSCRQNQLWWKHQHTPVDTNPIIKFSDQSLECSRTANQIRENTSTTINILSFERNIKEKCYAVVNIEPIFQAEKAVKPSRTGKAPMRYNFPLHLMTSLCALPHFENTFWLENSLLSKCNFL